MVRSNIIDGKEQKLPELEKCKNKIWPLENCRISNLDRKVQERIGDLCFSDIEGFSVRVALKSPQR